MPLKSIDPKLFSEMRDLTQWLGAVKKNPRQINTLNSADCELLKLSSKNFLALTTDSLSEEISYGLYQDPYTMGWVSAAASLSDLAAVGANPLGLLLSSQWAEDFSISDKRRCLKGFKDAVADSKTFLLGGDTGIAASTVLTSTGIGLCDQTPITRIGAKPGNLICTLGKLGIGPSLGFQLLLKKTNSYLNESHYRPRVSTHASQFILGHASAAMDSSDGFVQTLATLCKMNHVSAHLNWNPELFDARAVRFCRENCIPITSLLYGEHGDFQLIFTITKSKLKKISTKLKDLKILGEITPRSCESYLTMPNGAKKILEFEPTHQIPRDSQNSLHKAFDMTVRYLLERQLP